MAQTTGNKFGFNLLLTTTKMKRPSILSPTGSKNFPYETLPWRLELRDVVCYFECKEHMIKYLNKKDAKIRYYDPSGEKNEFKRLTNVRYCPNISSACLKSDLIVLHTEWNDFRFLNFKKLVKKDNFKIFDMRNIYSPAKMKNQKINYFSIGR